MKHFPKLLLIPVLFLLLTAPVHAAASGWDGVYTVTDWTQNCDSLVEYKGDQFVVNNGIVVNIAGGANAPISAAGTATIQHADPPAWMTVNFVFSKEGSTNVATGTWTGQSESGDCSGTLRAESNNFNFAPALWVVVVCCVCGIGLLALAFVFFLLVLRRRPVLQPVTLPPPEPPIMTNPLPPAPVPPAPAPGAKTPAATIPRPQTLGPKRAVYGKKTVPKKGQRIWAERTTKKP